MLYEQNVFNLLKYGSFWEDGVKTLVPVDVHLGLLWQFLISCTEGSDIGSIGVIGLLTGLLYSLLYSLYSLVRWCHRDLLE